MSPFSIFDIRRTCERSDGACVGTTVEWVRRYLKKPEKRAFFGIGAKSKFKTSVGKHVDTMLMPRFHIERTEHTASLAELLHHGIKVLVFAGDASYVSNYKGLESTLERMRWRGATKFNSTLSCVWADQHKKPLGEVRSASDLTFVRLYGTGHWVSRNVKCYLAYLTSPLSQAITDQQAVTTAMARAFVEGGAPECTMHGYRSVLLARKRVRRTMRWADDE